MKVKQAHNHDPAQIALMDQERPATRRSDPATSHDAAASVKHLRASHRRVIQLFRRFGAMTDEDALRAAIADGWRVSPSGLRSRRAEVTPPRGRGIRDSGRKAKLASGREATVWELDPGVQP